MSGTHAKPEPAAERGLYVLPLRVNGLSDEERREFMIWFAIVKPDVLKPLLAEFNSRERGLPDDPLHDGAKLPPIQLCCTACRERRFTDAGDGLCNECRDGGMSPAAATIAAAYEYPPPDAYRRGPGYRGP